MAGPDPGDPVKLLQAGIDSYRRGEAEAAHRAFAQAISSGNYHTVPDDQGDVAGVRRYYQRVTTSQRTKDDDIHPRVAAARLEVMLTQHGELDSARAVYERATDHRQPDERIRFAFNRADAWKRRGNLAAAAESLREIVAEDSPRAPTAAYMLGHVLRDHGDLEGARAAFQIAIDSGDPELAPQAASMQRRCS